MVLKFLFSRHGNGTCTVDLYILVCRENHYVRAYPVHMLLIAFYYSIKALRMGFFSLFKLLANVFLPLTILSYDNCLFMKKL